jgi:hypothetical protein
MRIDFPPAAAVGAYLATYTFATLPSAGITTGTQALVTDVGAAGSVWIWNGTIWVPVNGAVVLAQGSPGAAITGSAGTNQLLIPTISIPGGLLGANGQIEIIANLTFTNNSNNKYVNLELGSVADGPALFYTANLASQANQNLNIRVCNNNSQTSQVIFNAGPSTAAGYGGFGADTSSVYTLSRDTGTVAHPPLLYFYGKVANGADTITLISYRVVLYPHA